MSIINLHGTPSVKVKREVRLLDPLYSNSAYQPYTLEVFHCDGLLLCTSNDKSRVLVYNPLTNQSRCIQFNIRYDGCNYFFLGYNQNNKSCNKSYKVLSFDRGGGTNSVTIYELKSDSYRILDDGNNPGWLKINGQEKLGRHVILPYQCQEYENLNVSVVKEEKLSVALQRGTTSKTEIWVTDEIDETKAVSWSKVLALDLSCDYEITDHGSFSLDEEKKVVVCCETWCDPQDWKKSKEMIYIVGEDSKVTELDLGVDITGICGTAIRNYTPSLVQIELDGPMEAKEKYSM
ncbi:hypothetical protein Bca52824_025979 [Brassica carinata]|uniref:F-box associated beta-propeller type 1 domain-containing protein n=1 Tax=Brassica carinata TaxID=52824 RepID=A0A8X7VA46_BRACI|nr:hypothetical protein Bca52824_025979 [Brassica carinata]